VSQAQATWLQTIRMQARSISSAGHLRHIARNAGILLATTLVLNAVTIPYVAFLARKLGVVGFGSYSVAFTFVNIAVMVIDMGTGKLLTRELSGQEHKGPSIVGASLAPKPILTVVSLCAAVGISYALGYSSKQTVNVGLAILIATMMAVAVAARAVFHSYQRMEFDSVGMSSERLVTITCSVGAVLAGYGVTGVLCAALCGNLADASVSWFLVHRRFVRHVARPSWELIRAYLVLGFPLFVTALASTLYLRANVLILDGTSGTAAAGLFNAAFQMLVLALYVPQVLAVAIFPHFARLARGNTKAMLRASRNGAMVMAATGAAFALTLILVAGWLIPLLYTDRFHASVWILRILACTLPFTFVSSLLQQVLIATNRQGFVGRATVCAAIINIALNLVLDRSMGTTGTALVAVGTECLMALMFGYAVLRLARGD
jgi:O-antigen/teichoic acid export membrane protein